MSLNLTQCMALAHLHRNMKDFLYNYAEGKLQAKFFLEGMDGIISQIDNFVRENGSYNCSYSRSLLIADQFLANQSLEPTTKKRGGSV